MNTSNISDATYVLGHPTGEERRLQRLGQVLYPSTKALLEQAGIAAGMKVLDVGSGTGDCALVLTELVGPTGSVLGVEIYPAALETARARVEAAGFTNVSFISGDIRQLKLNPDFDAAVGRNVLIYVADQSEVLRVCADHVRPGGIIAFHELEWSISEQVAAMAQVPPLFRQALGWIADGFRRAGAQMQMGFKFPAAFHRASLPSPHMQLDGILGTTTDWPGYDLFADVLRDILPKLQEYDILPGNLDADGYVEQMRSEASQQHTPLPLFFMAGAWAKVTS